MTGEDAGVPYEKGGSEYMSVDGEELRIVPPRPDTDFRSLSQDQSRAVMEIYRILSSMLPLEGRDYGIRISFPDGDASRPSIRFDPRNELGILWCRYMSEHLPEEVRKRSNR